MTENIATRMKQGFTYLFGTYNKKWNSEIHKHLKTKELLIFNNMDNYDKIHSYQLFQNVKNNEILGNEELFLKLALLHDCGKNNLSLFSRIFNALRGRKAAETHCEAGFEKLKDINLDLANLVKNHHSETDDEKMLEFQKLDCE